ITDVELCEKQEKLANELSVNVSRILCKSARDSTYVYISTDQLWNDKKAFVVESDEPKPINAYGRSKLAGEITSLETHTNPLILRTNYFGNGTTWRRSLSDWVLDNLKESNTVNMYSDIYFTPLAIKHLCNILIQLATGKASGIIHLASRDRISKYEFGIKIAKYFGFSEKFIN
ncbi:MAG: sugar nucleotide-binding protein, partial [Candidatus Dadabacteria bacterium]|nr:sugar nucleotide-binding protein [Candidatus Dadabacteria bacterium]